MPYPVRPKKIQITIDKILRLWYNSCMAKKKQEYSRMYLVGEVNESMLNQFNRDFDNALARNASAIVLELTSCGGDFYIALAIYNRIKASPVPVLTLASGQCMSSAILIFSAGHKRLSRPNTWFLIHSLSMELHGKKPLLAAEYHQLEIEQEQYATLVAKNTKTDAQHILKLMETESYLTAEQALELGVVDELQPID